MGSELCFDISNEVGTKVQRSSYSNERELDFEIIVAVRGRVSLIRNEEPRFQTLTARVRKGESRKWSGIHIDEYVRQLTICE